MEFVLPRNPQGSLLILHLELYNKIFQAIEWVTKCCSLPKFVYDFVETNWFKRKTQNDDSMNEFHFAHWTHSTIEQKITCCNQIPQCGAHSIGSIAKCHFIKKNLPFFFLLGPLVLTNVVTCKTSGSSVFSTDIVRISKFFGSHFSAICPKSPNVPIVQQRI